MDLFDVLGISTITEDLKNNILPPKISMPIIDIKPIKYSYRPETLKNYIGQGRAKDLISLNLKKIEEIKPVHFIISGPKGTGKSSIANIIANELGFEMNWYIGGAFTKDHLVKFLVKNQDAGLPQILFIDEIHNLPKDLAEYLYPIIEDFILPEGNNLKLRPFIFIGATTEKNIILKTMGPLVDRCSADIVLEQYTENDIINILKQYNDKVYQYNISEDVYEKIAKNTRLTPRIALSFFDDFVVCNNTDQIFSAHRVIKDGLTIDDIKILRYLKEINKPVGVETLAMIIGLTKEDYMYTIEPYLINKLFISRTPRGRIILKNGVDILESIDNE